ncbi:MAG TPA: hypothetical protein VKK31_23005 [Thermoanaerobaculia bacterium]|nr:hypothetical protein [Thermoanaerobaculia bacterium]
MRGLRGHGQLFKDHYGGLWLEGRWNGFLQGRGLGSGEKLQGFELLPPCSRLLENLVLSIDRSRGKRSGGGVDTASLPSRKVNAAAGRRKSLLQLIQNGGVGGVDGWGWLVHARAWGAKPRR